MQKSPPEKSSTQAVVGKYDLCIHGINPYNQAVKTVIRLFYLRYLKRYSIIFRAINWIRRKYLVIYTSYQHVLSKYRIWLPLLQQSKCDQQRYDLLKPMSVHSTVALIFPSLYKMHFQDKYLFPEIFIAVIAKAVVSGGTNLVTSQQKVYCHDLYDFRKDLISEELHRRVIIDPIEHKIHWTKKDRKPAIMSIGASFVDACAANYAHWLTEVLPRIYLFISDKRFNNIPIIINDGLHDNIMSSLSLIIEKTRKIILLPVGRSILLNELFITSPTAYVPFGKRSTQFDGYREGQFSPCALLGLREQILKRVNLEEGKCLPKKIFLKRLSPVRQLINEKEVEYHLEKKGFTVMSTDYLTFEQQILLFQHAEVIIGATGASLANLIFCNVNTKICVLMGIHKAMPYKYWLNMGFSVGVTHISYILGDIIKNTARDFHGDFHINIGYIEAYLKNIEGLHDS